MPALEQNKSINENYFLTPVERQVPSEDSFQGCWENNPVRVSGSLDLHSDGNGMLKQVIAGLPDLGEVMFAY